MADPSRVIRILVICLAALLVAAPAAGAKKPGKSHGPSAKACNVAKAAKSGKKACARRDGAKAQRRCRAEQRDLGAAAFRARYGGKRRAFGRCVSSWAKDGKRGARADEPAAGVDEDLEDDAAYEDEEDLDEYEDFDDAELGEDEEEDFRDEELEDEDELVDLDEGEFEEFEER